jgi:hypothetical protein
MAKGKVNHRDLGRPIYRAPIYIYIHTLRRKIINCDRKRGKSLDPPLDLWQSNRQQQWF